MGSQDSSKRSAAAGGEREPLRFAQVTIERLFEFSPDAILITDSEGTVRAANPRAEELFGYASEDLIGQPVDMLVPQRFRGVHPSHRENYSAHPRARQMGADLNLFGVRKDGTEFPVDIMLKPVETGDGPAVVSFVRDMTEQRAAQETLRQYDLRLRSIVENVGEYAIYLLDHDGHIMTWNTGAERIKGYKADEVLGLHFSRFFIQEDVERGLPAELLRHAAAKGRVEEDGWRVRKDGSRFWANAVITAIRDSAGELTGFSKITRDVTERRQAQESMIAELSSALLANVDIRKLLGAVSASMRQMLPHDAATLALYDEGTGKLRTQFLERAGEAATREGEMLLDSEASPAGQAFRTRVPVVVNRLDDGSFPPQSVHHLTRMGMKSGIWVPLLGRERTLGTLMVASRNESAFGEREAETLGQVAGQVAMAVNSALAIRQLADLHDRLNQEKQ